jgi:hypothetical protein
MPAPVPAPSRQATTYSARPVRTPTAVCHDGQLRPQPAEDVQPAHPLLMPGAPGAHNVWSGALHSRSLVSEHGGGR